MYKENRNLYLLKFINFYKNDIFVLSLLNLISSTFFLTAPYISKLFIDKAFINKDPEKFLNLSILGAGLFALSMSVTVIRDIVKNKKGVKLEFNLSNKFINKFFSLDLSYFKSQSVGENVYRFSDTETIVNFLIEQCPQILGDIFKLIIILWVSLWLNAQMTVFLLVLSPLYLLHSLYLQKKLKPIYEELWRGSAKLSKEIYEAFSRVLIIKAIGLESYQRRVYLRSLIKNLRLRIKNFRWTTISFLSSSVLSKAIYGAITLYGGWLIIKGRLSIGNYAAVMIYLVQLGVLLDSLRYRFEYFAKEIVSLENFFEVIETRSQIKDSPGAKSLESIKGEIRFKNVRFGYQQGKPIFKRMDFVIPVPSWAAIVGPSGCGKTTLVNLLLRLYEPWEGEIFLGSLKLREIRLRSLRERVTIATQQPLLFDVSVRENIRYGLRGIGQGKIEEASRIACIHDFITKLPQGYDTFIGEDACRLSHGLKQRIAIARAILKNSDILILDEATSSIDSPTEEKIFQSLRKIREGLSTIVISHRLFSVKDAGRIFFLIEDGKIEQGSHQDLLSESALYRDFFSNQIEKR